MLLLRLRLCLLQLWLDCSCRKPVASSADRARLWSSSFAAAPSLAPSCRSVLPGVPTILSGEGACHLWRPCDRESAAASMAAFSGVMKRRKERGGSCFGGGDQAFETTLLGGKAVYAGAFLSEHEVARAASTRRRWTEVRTENLLINSASNGAALDGRPSASARAMGAPRLPRKLAHHN